jgi:histidinol-phosphatase (PHP family)
MEEMVETAISRGFVSLGFSSHARQDFDLRYGMAQDREAAYIAEVHSLQLKYKGRIRLWLGIERDYFSTADGTLYDYVIGSVHYVGHDGCKVVVDGSAAQLREDITYRYAGDGAAFAMDYYRLLGHYISRYKPAIIGHFDLVMKNNRRHELFDPQNAKVLRAAYDALSDCFKGCRLMEVNTGAMARSGAEVPYPAIGLLRHWRDMGGQVILSSDCHFAPQIDANYTEGLRLMREAGYHEMQILGRYDVLFETVPLY